MWDEILSSSPIHQLLLGTGGVLTIIDQPLSDAFIHWYIDIVIFRQVALICGDVEVDGVVSGFGYTVSIVLQWLSLAPSTKSVYSSPSDPAPLPFGHRH
jgi:hypothetical protein